MLYFAGFKSRVKYISVLDPSTLCYYVSEILDAGREGPLFMVNLGASRIGLFSAFRRGRYS